MDIPEYALDLLLSHDGRELFLETGHFLKFEVRTVSKIGARSSRHPLFAHVACSQRTASLGI